MDEDLGWASSLDTRFNEELRLDRPSPFEQWRAQRQAEERERAKDLPPAYIWSSWHHEKAETWHVRLDCGCPAPCVETRRSHCVIKQRFEVPRICPRCDRVVHAAFPTITMFSPLPEARWRPCRDV